MTLYFFYFIEYIFTDYPPFKISQTLLKIAIALAFALKKANISQEIQVLIGLVWFPCGDIAGMGVLWLFAVLCELKIIT